MNMESSVFISLICCMALISTAYTHMYDAREANYYSSFQHRRRLRRTESGLCAYARPPAGVATPGTPRPAVSRPGGPLAYAASHRALPLGSLVNVDTGANSVTVRIAGHRTGPGHLLDLSARAARALHIDGGAPRRCEVTVVHVGGRRGGRRGGCEPTWSGTCRSSADCCSGRCVRVPGGARVCFPRHFRLRKVAQSYVDTRAV